MKKLGSGFTLIELLVVISIVGVLSSVVLATVATARSKARDAQRISDLKQIQAAIELYALDNGGAYPGYKANENTFARSSQNANEGPATGCGYGETGTPGDGNPLYDPGIWCRLETALAPYIKALPRTQVVGGVYYHYTYKVPQNSATYNPNDYKGYGLGVQLENTSRVSQNDGGYYADYFELGPMPRYCQAQASPPARNWSAWSANPCSCQEYYTMACGY